MDILYWNEGGGFWGFLINDANGNIVEVSKHKLDFTNIFACLEMDYGHDTNLLHNPLNSILHRWRIISMKYK